MIYIILGVCIILLILGFILIDLDYDGVGFSFICVGGIIGAIFAIVLHRKIGKKDATF